LSKKLDLVHVCVENWLLRLQDKIKNYEAPEDLEEGQEAPKWLTDLEERVNQALKAGSGPSVDDVLEILKEELQSPLAKTKGYILDLNFFKAKDAWAKLIRTQRLLGEDSNGMTVQFSHVVELDVEDDEAKLRASGMLLDPSDGQVYSRW
jgi:hypothetical protein